MFRKVIYLIHILFVAPLLTYSGYIGRELSKSSEESTGEKRKKIFNLLIITGIIVFLYHLYKLIM